MRQIRKLLCAFAALCLLLSLPAAASAADSEMDALYRDKSWEEVVQTLLDKYAVAPASVTMGYYNTVTGEEHYFNGDQYMVSGSMYKVPLNMAFAEKVAAGEMSWDDEIGAYTLGGLRDETIIYSNNDLARTLWTKLSNNVGYHRYREIIAPLMGEDAETVNQKYYENNFFTARQMIYCLKLLYDNPERFPTILETMQKAEPNEYFKLKERRFNIGHKYGFLVTEYHQYINDCGIAFTDDPILLVMFTDNVTHAYSVLTEYCTLMCDYAQYHRAERVAAEKAKAAEEERARLEEAAAALQSPEPTPRVSLLRPQAEESPSEPESAPRVSGIGLAPFIVALLILMGALAALVLLSRWRRRYRLRLPWAVLTVLLCAAALLLSTLAVSSGTLVARPGGDPQEAVSAFFEELRAGDYEGAYARLSGCSGLGLEDPPGSEADRLLREALRQSYACTLIGASSVDALQAHQQMQFRYLDIPSLTEDLRRETLEVMANFSRTRAHNEIYDSNNDYLPEVAREAYTTALANTLEHAEDYYSTTDIQLSLRYSGDGWKIVPDAGLLKALAGGLSY